MRFVAVAMACAVACASLVSVRDARAQSAGAAAGSTEEEEDIRQGVAMRRAGRDVDAAPFFQRAYDRARSPRAAAQLGLCEQALGRWVLAERHVREALASASDPWVARTRATLESAVSVAEQHLGTIELVGGTDGAEVFFDGELVGSLPTARSLRWVTGTIRVELRLRGAPSIVRTVELGAGAIERVALPAQSASTGAATGPANDTHTNSSGTAAQGLVRDPRRAVAPPLRVHALVWGGAAGVGAGAIVTVIGFVVGNGIEAAYNSECVQSASAPESCVARFGSDQSALQSMTAVTATGWALIGAGAVASGVGIALTFTGRREEPASVRAVVLGDRVAVVGRF